VRLPLAKKTRRAANAGKKRPGGRSAPAPKGRLREGRIGVGVIALAVVAGALLTDRVAPVPQLRVLFVAGAARLSDRELAGATGVARGDALLGIDASAVAERLAAHAWVRSAQAARLPTGSLVVAIEEREPRAVLTGPQPHAIGADGTPFAAVAEGAFPELPRVACAAPPAPGEPSSALAAAVQLAERLAGLGLPPAEEVAIGSTADPHATVLRLRGLAPRFLLGRDVDAALARLAKLIVSGPPQVLLAATVDLRFQDQAVLRHEPPQAGAAPVAEPRSVAAASRGRRSG
jgi:cell division protein FtsQ